MHPVAQDCQRSIFHLGLPTNDALPGATRAIRGRVRVIATVRWPTERLAQASSTISCHIRTARLLVAGAVMSIPVGTPLRMPVCTPFNRDCRLSSE